MLAPARICRRLAACVEAVITMQIRHAHDIVSVQTSHPIFCKMWALENDPPCSIARATKARRAPR
jgi:hypothetical protein